jgi:hypothetical protein
MGINIDPNTRIQLDADTPLIERDIAYCPPECNTTVRNRGVLVAVLAPALIMFTMIALWGADVIAVFSNDIAGVHRLGICVGPFTVVFDYIPAASWFPGRNL